MSYRSARNVLAVASVTLGLAGIASAQTIFTQWNFNSNPPDASTSTGTTTPSIGAGTLSLVGGTTATFASGDASGGSSDPATSDDSAWNVTGWPAASGANLSAGVQALTSTVGFENIQISFDQRHSNTASRFIGFQYTTDGSTWTTVTDASLLTAGSTNANTGSGDAGVGATAGYAYWEKNPTGDTWSNQRGINLSSIPGVNDNPNFGFRILTAHDPTSGQFIATSTTGTYATTSTLRLDMLTVRGTAIAVPEPGAAALIGLAMLPGVALLRRRK